MSPRIFRGTIRERTGPRKNDPRELTSDARAVIGVKHRQRLAIGEDGDVT